MKEDKTMADAKYTVFIYWPEGGLVKNTAESLRGARQMAHGCLVDETCMAWVSYGEIVERHSTECSSSGCIATLDPHQVVFELEHCAPVMQKIARKHKHMTAEQVGEKFVLYMQKRGIPAFRWQEYLLFSDWRSIVEQEFERAL